MPVCVCAATGICRFAGGTIGRLQAGSVAQVSCNQQEFCQSPDAAHTHTQCGQGEGEGEVVCMQRIAGDIRVKTMYALEVI